MAIRTFGTTFTYDFYPLASDGYSYQSLPATPDSVYLFDGYPSLDDAQNGTTNDGNYSILETLVTWADTPDTRGKRLSFAAIAQPDTELSKKYYIAINVTLDTAIAPIIKEVTMQKLRSQESRIDVSISDIIAMEPALEMEFGKCYDELDLYIDSAVTELRMMLSGCNIEWAHYSNPAALNHAVIQLALSKFYFGQARTSDSIQFTTGERYKYEFQQSLKRTGLNFDSNEDGIPDGVRKPPRGIKSLRILK